VCIAVAAAQSESQAVITKQTSDINPDGSYTHEYQTSNGISGSESGVGGQYAQGANSYYAPDGQLIQITYTADENGYQAQGAHLPTPPTPPPIPAAILRSLEWNRNHPEQEESNRPRGFQG
jgi:hypothetical protein